EVLFLPAPHRVHVLRVVDGDHLVLVDLDDVDLHAHVLLVVEHCVHDDVFGQVSLHHCASSTLGSVLASSMAASVLGVACFMRAWTVSSAALLASACAARDSSRRAFCSGSRITPTTSFVVPLL